MQLTPIAQSLHPLETMSSLDFLNDYINPARIAAGEPVVRNNKFLVKICDELDFDISLAQKVQGSTNQFEQKYFNLTHDQMMLVGMRESKQVRKTVLDKLNELSRPRILSQDQQLLQLAEGVIRLTAERDEAIRTKSQINDKRTATLMAKASHDSKRIKKLEDQLQNQGDYLSMLAANLPDRVDTEARDNVQSWRLLKEISTRLSKPVKKVQDARFGMVNTYHVDVIAEFKEMYL